MTFNELKEAIKELYDDFFVDMMIDPQTGRVADTNLRFSGYPYIGANYVSAPFKILFIPLDTGKDEREKDDTFHSFESRESIFTEENIPLKELNAHIAGLYATSLYILKDKMGWNQAWETLWSKRNYKTAKAIREVTNKLPKGLMTYVAYENRYRFVRIGRKERGNGSDRVWLNAERESQLLFDEINAFSPDIIVFQGLTGLWNCHIPELQKKFKIVKALHPACWQRRADWLQYIVERIAPQL